MLEDTNSFDGAQIQWTLSSLSNWLCSHISQEFLHFKSGMLHFLLNIYNTSVFIYKYLSLP